MLGRYYSHSQKLYQRYCTRFLYARSPALVYWRENGTLRASSEGRSMATEAVRAVNAVNKTAWQGDPNE